MRTLTKKYQISFFAITLIIVCWCSGCRSANSLLPQEDVVRTPFENADWRFENPQLWKKVDHGVTLWKTKPSLYPFRRPYQVAYLRTPTFLKEFDLKAEVKATSDINRKGRDIIVVFGYQSPMRFYYIHLSNDNSVEYHNGVFVVNHGDRKRIDDQGLSSQVPAMIVDQEWHTVHVMRDATGHLQVSLDDQLLFTATDLTIPSGYIGFGSFDDTGSIRNIRLALQ